MHRLARKIEHDLNAKLAQKNNQHAEIASLLTDFRVACENTIFADFQYAFEHKIEALLWAAHSKVNVNFRKQLSLLNKEGKNKAVETRLVTKQYLEFIKASQRFYRQYILRLDRTFGGIPELRKIARTWKSDFSRETLVPNVSPEIKRQVKSSLYQTVIQLGDLSRYRELQRQEKDRNWSHAVGYYGLANSIYPESGISHNQQAVIALADGSHFRATYHLYRSLATKEPHPAAKGNLELEFKKVIQAWEKGELIGRQANREGNGANRALISWFVRLHSKCYKGEEFAGHDELENEVLSQLAVELKERSLDGLLQKFVLVNISAEHFASEQLQNGHTEPQNLRSYFYFLRLNVKTFFILLQILQPELEFLTGEDVNGNEDDHSKQLSDKVTAVARRILPGLRLYSAWFMNTWHILSADIEGFEGSVSKVEVQEMWKAYAETLTLLVSVFEPSHLPMEQYMLEEDVETIGFQPLVTERTKKIWYVGEELKPKWSDEGVERNHPNMEMLMRIRDFLVDGLELTQDQSAPLALVGTRFIYQEAGIPSQVMSSPGEKAEPVAPVEMPVEIPRGEPNGPVTDDQTSHGVAPSETASVAISKDVAMNRMVDELLGPEDGLDPLPEEDENMPPTPPEQTFEDTALINDHSYGITPVTVGDFVNMVRNYSQASCTPEVSHRNSTASPAVRNLPSLPSLPNTSDIWNKNYESPMQSTPAVPPGLNVSSGAYGRQSMSHSRHASLNNSMNAFSWSPNPIPQGRSSSMADPFTASYDGTLPNFQLHGNAMPGNGSGFNGQVQGIPHDLNMSPYPHDVNTSPLPFGHDPWGAGSGIWGADLSQSRGSFTHTPPNGHGG
ncbi:Telomerase activating protein Est1 [Botryosphaeria dothidea]|uniref:Telomerase activating protein Est1 n=1 Tax=Botryosphaeria dothidea TaxID=55169 RepID=A0A8H4MYP4_9PEZI|nr:Telomerase activating protein Est1 [Botryosphaeria dothidea]KAF4305669.1 Telomerase activating protein Est1 [Botryosphaeria dothidea]